MAVTFCTSGQALLKAGKNVSTDFKTAAPSNMTSTQAIEGLINQAESYICDVTRVNYIDTFASLNDDTKKLLEDASSSHAAMAMIQYDMNSYTSRAEAQTMLNVNYTRLVDAVKLLNDDKVRTFINNG